MTPAPKVPKPECDGCAAAHWYLTSAGDRRLCEECLEAFIAKRTEEDVELPDEPEKLGVWRYDEACRWIARHYEDETFDDALQFTLHGVPEKELLTRILAMMNGWDQ